MKHFWYVWYIAALTALELRRRWIVMMLWLVMLFLLATATVLAMVTMGSTVEIIVDFGLASMAILSNMAAIFVTSQSMQQDKEQRTLYALLPRLPSRIQYVLGKYLGLLLIFLLVVLGMTIMLAGVIFWFGWDNWGMFLQASLAVVFELALAIAITMLFSNSTSIMITLFFSIAINIAARFTFVIYEFGQEIGGVFANITDIIYALLPNFQVLNLRNNIMHDMLPLHEMLLITSYTITEVALLLALSCFFFLKKDLQSV
ncbi:MAG: hypothetical protein R8K21_08760 [Mariprofundales bacterium]